MKAIVQERCVSPDDLERRDVETPAVGDDDVAHDGGRDPGEGHHPNLTMP